MYILWDNCEVEEIRCGLPKMHGIVPTKKILLIQEKRKTKKQQQQKQKKKCRLAVITVGFCFLTLLYLYDILCQTFVYLVHTLERKSGKRN